MKTIFKRGLAGRNKIWTFLNSLAYRVYGLWRDNHPNHPALKSKSGFEFFKINEGVGI